MEKRGIIYVISAPSGAGKTTLINRLRERLANIGFSVSHTTRKPRPGEIDDIHYHFVTPDQFRDMIRVDAFVEWAEVHGNLYGTSWEAMEKELKAGRDVILDIDVQGGAQVAAKIEGTVRIFVLPPSMEELERRLRSRNKDPEEVITRRLYNAKKEMDMSRDYDYVMINGEFEEALKDLESIIRATRLRNDARKKG